MTADPDDLSDLLGPTPPSPDHDRAKAAIIQATTRRLAWDRRLRRARMVTAVAAVFAAGGTTGWLAKPVPPPVPTPEPIVYPVPVVVLPPAADPPPAPSAGEYVSAERYELRAEQAADPAESARLYRLAGGQYEARSEYGQASRCYRLYLLAAGPAGKAVSTDDSWLLMSVKTNHKETARDPKQGS